MTVIDISISLLSTIEPWIHKQQNHCHFTSKVPGCAPPLLPYISMTSCVRVLSTTTVDSSPAILLVAPNGSKTLINCGEGCQRIFLEFGQKLSTVNRVCLTHLSHSTLGGLPGMILTSADVMVNSAIAVAKHKAEKKNSHGHVSNDSQQSEKKRQLTPTGELPGIDILGPAGTDAFIHSLRHFMRREAFRLTVHTGECSQQPSTDKPTKRPKSSKTCQGIEQQDFYVQTVPCDLGDGRQALSFIFTSPPIPGKFLIQKAIALNIPRGPLYTNLKNGKAVTFADPKTGKECRVESSQVVEPGIPGVAVLVLYYPTLHVLNQLKSSQALARLLSNEASPSTKNPEVDLIIHMTSQHCFETEESSGWRLGISQNIEHVFLDTSLPITSLDPGTPFHSTAAGASCRSSLSSDLFVAPPARADQPDFVGEAAARVRQAVPLLEYTLIPRSKKGFVNAQAHNYHRKAVDEQMMNLLQTSGALHLVRGLLPNQARGSNGGAEVIFTGTGSAIPCKHRNVSGIYLQMTNHNGILLDIGEGTIGQLARAKQHESIEDILRRIRAVWISHPHADHHLGILRLLADRTRCLGATDKSLILIAPSRLRDFLLEYEKVDPLVVGSYIFLDSNSISTRSPPGGMDRANDTVLQRLQVELGITDIRSTPVQHCAHSYAVTLRGTSFGTVAYSGDCRPSRNFAEDAQGADLLIHEATFTDGMEAEASLKRHCTVGEALEIAHLMNSKATVLTHFSQRFPKIPPVSLSDSQHQHTAVPLIFAFDYMRLTPQNLVTASNITPALRLLYPEESRLDDADELDNIGTAVDAGVLETPGLFAQKEIL
jgi:ribonuclease Z